MKDGYLLRAFFDSPWAILPARLEAITEVLRLHASAVQVNAEVLAQIRAAQPKPARSEQRGSIAVIRVLGVISQRAEMVDDISGPGGTSTQRVARRLTEAVQDRSVDSIILDIDSPGGSVYGVEELGDQIFRARQEKHVAAVANSLAASAAFWLGSQASEFVVTPSGEVGSVGVVAVHVDWSAWNAKEGIKPTYVTAGRFKAELNPDTPLGDEARSYLQGRVDDYYGAFVAAVARGRGVTAADVRKNFGEGRLFGADDAKRAHMVDRVETFEQVVDRLGGSATAAASELAANVQCAQEIMELSADAR